MTMSPSSRLNPPPARPSNPLISGQRYSTRVCPARLCKDSPSSRDERIICPQSQYTRQHWRLYPRATHREETDRSNHGACPRRHGFMCPSCRKRTRKECVETNRNRFVRFGRRFRLCFARPSVRLPRRLWRGRPLSTDTIGQTGQRLGLQLRGPMVPAGLCDGDPPLPPPLPAVQVRLSPLHTENTETSEPWLLVPTERGQQQLGPQKQLTPTHSKKNKLSRHLLNFNHSSWAHRTISLPTNKRVSVFSHKKKTPKQVSCWEKWLSQKNFLKMYSQQWFSCHENINSRLNIHNFHTCAKPRLSL